MSNLILPVKNAFITQRFDGLSARDNGHKHGAIDLSAPNGIGTEILAPESGYIFGYFAVRDKENKYWPEQPEVHDYEKFQFCNYFYDMYGGVTFLESEKEKRTHLFCHSYNNQIFNKTFNGPTYTIEQKEDSRFPILGVYTIRKYVKAGERIGFIGKAGFNLGTHLHWEIHNGFNSYQIYEKRIDPESLLNKKDIKYAK